MTWAEDRRLPGRELAQAGALRTFSTAPVCDLRRGCIIMNSLDDPDTANTDAIRRAASPLLKQLRRQPEQLRPSRRQRWTGFFKASTMATVR